MADGAAGGAARPRRGQSRGVTSIPHTRPIDSVPGPADSKDPAAMTQVAARTWSQVRPSRKSVPEGLWLRCPGCGGMIYRKQMEANLHVCPDCSHHFRIGAVERVKQLADTDTFQPMFT